MADQKLSALAAATATADADLFYIVQVGVSKQVSGAVLRLGNIPVGSFTRGTFPIANATPQLVPLAHPAQANRHIISTAVDVVWSTNTLDVQGASIVNGSLVGNISGGGTLATGGFTLTLGAASTVNGSLVGNISGGGTLATGGFTLTVPATATAAIREGSNTFGGHQLASSGFFFEALTNGNTGGFAAGAAVDVTLSRNVSAALWETNVGINIGGNVTLPTTNWIGLGAAAGRLVFTDTTLDTAVFTSAAVGVGGAPEANAVFEVVPPTTQYYAKFTPSAWGLRMGNLQSGIMFISMGVNKTGADNNYMAMTGNNASVNHRIIETHYDGTVNFYYQAHQTDATILSPASQFKIATSGAVSAPAGCLSAGGDTGGIASHNTLSNVSDITANSTGVGTIKMKGATSRDSAGFVKFYIGATAYYVPVFSAITG